MVLDWVARDRQWKGRLIMSTLSTHICWKMAWAATSLAASAARMTETDFMVLHKQNYDHYWDGFVTERKIW